MQNSSISNTWSIGYPKSTMIEQLQHENVGLKNIYNMLLRDYQILQYSKEVLEQEKVLHVSNSPFYNRKNVQCKFVIAKKVAAVVCKPGRKGRTVGLPFRAHTGTFRKEGNLAF
jgi:hypothetical protein